MNIYNNNLAYLIRFYALYNIYFKKQVYGVIFIIIN